jgi:hypothetical protein
MNLEFDREYMVSRLNRNDTRSRYEMKKLFAHEAFHGLGGRHEGDNPASVMYPNISAGKTSEIEFTKHFNKVRDFYQARSSF